jgi:peroxiredoxin
VRGFILKKVLAVGLVVFALHGAASAADLFKAMGVLRPEIRMEAPAFTLRDVGGEQQSLSAFRGKVILLKLWATWCPNCREEMPSLEKLYEKFKSKGVVVVAVVIDGSVGDVKSLARKMGLTFPILFDVDKKVRRAYEVTALPMTYIIGKDGKISGRLYGNREWEGKDPDALIDYLLQKGI